MKEFIRKTKSDLIDWMLSIDFDPVEMKRKKVDIQCSHVGTLDRKALKVKGGD